VGCEYGLYARPRRIKGICTCQSRIERKRKMKNGTYSLRMCSSMHFAQNRCRHGETTLTFFIVPQHTAHRVSWRTGPSFMVRRSAGANGNCEIARGKRVFFDLSPPGKSAGEERV